MGRWSQRNAYQQFRTPEKSSRQLAGILTRTRIRKPSLAKNMEVSRSIGSKVPVYKLDHGIKRIPGRMGWRLWDRRVIQCMNSSQKIPLGRIYSLKNLVSEHYPDIKGFRTHTMMNSCSRRVALRALRWVKWWAWIKAKRSFRSWAHKCWRRATVLTKPKFCCGSLASIS